LFGEAQSRILVTVSSVNLPFLQEKCASLDVPMTVLGTTGGERLNISGVVDQTIDILRDAYEGGLTELLTASFQNV
jgi:hypothetical protein